MSENEKGYGRRAGKAPERSNFTQACTLLSQFLKDKRNLANPDFKEKLEINMTKNFLPNIEGATAQNGVVSVIKSTDFLQKIVGLSPSDDYTYRADLRITTTQPPQPSQMTIFYSGQVLVFNDLPAEKGDEIITLARKACSNVNSSVLPSTATTNNSPIVVIETIDLTNSDEPKPNNITTTATNKAVTKNKADVMDIDINKSSNESEDADVCVVKSISTGETLQQRSSEPASGSELPIARRNSLHRFLEKRKDRVGAKAPYQISNRVGMPPRKPDESSSQGGGGECSEKNLELKL